MGRARLAALPPIPFHRDFVRPIFGPLGIGDDEFAWLPIVKFPLPASSKIPDDDIFANRMVLWDQLSMLRPQVILVLGNAAASVVRPMCEDKFPHVILELKIGWIGTTSYHADEDDRVRRELARALKIG